MEDFASLMADVVTRNSYVAAAKFVMSKMEPEQEARKVAQAIAKETGKFMAAHGQVSWIQIAGQQDRKSESGMRVM
jgi:hypothetical protein